MIDAHPSSPRCLILYWGTSGAGIRFTQRIAAELSSHFGRDHIAMSLHAQNDWLQQAHEVSADVDAIASNAGRKRLLTSLLELLPQFFRLKKLIKKRGIETMIIPMNFALASPVSLLLSWSGLRIIYVIHDANPHPGDYVPRMQRWSQAALIHAAARVVALSSYVGESIRSSLPVMHQGSLEISPLGALVQRKVREARNLSAKPVKFLFLGRLLAYKGLDLLAEALADIKDRHDWCLTIAGNGELRDDVVQAFKAYKQVDLSHLVWLHEGDVDHLLMTHDIVLCPYSEASQSGVVAEACALGLPSVVTPVGGLAEQVGHGLAGWITRAATSAALAETLLTILNNREAYQDKSSGALAMAMQNVGDSNWAEIVERFCNQPTSTTKR